MRLSRFRLLALLTLAPLSLALLSPVSLLHAQDTIPQTTSKPYELCGGYTWLSNSFDGVSGQHQPLNGGELSFATPAWHNLRFKLDVSVYRGISQSAPQHAMFVTAGGQYSHRIARESLFAEALFGGGSLNRNWLPNQVPGQTASFTTILGGGLDTPFSRRFAFRIQADYLYTNFNVALAFIPSPYPIYAAVVHGLPNNFAHLATGIVWRF